MKEEKYLKTIKVFKFILLIFIISFAALYLSQATGYYAFEEHKKMSFTEEQIKKFEQDVKDGKNIDINNYMKNTNNDYQSKTSKFGLQVSDQIGKTARKSIESIFTFLGKFVE